MEALRGAPTKKALVFLQSSVAVEIELSCLAAVDVAETRRFGFQDRSIFLSLIPRANLEELNPGALFFRWLLARCGETRMSDLARKVELTGAPLHPVTLRKWKKGSHMPSEDGVKAICEAYSIDRETAEVRGRLWAAKVLSMLGYMVQTVQGRLHKQLSACPPESLNELEALIRPWPDFPHGYATFPKWASSRYQFWLDYHNRRIEKV
jgi:hypothetical protein